VPLFKFLGSFFIYKSPRAGEGYAGFLQYLSNRQLRKIAGTTSHYDKKTLIHMILANKNKS